MRRPLAITILGINFAPERTGIAPYTSKLASGLTARGHSVRVITTFPHYPQWRIHAGYRGLRSEEDYAGVAVTRLRHYVPGRPVGFRRALSEVSFGVRLHRMIDPCDVAVLVSPALLSSAMALRALLQQRNRPAVGLIVQDIYSAGVTETGATSAAATRAITGIERWTMQHVDGVAAIHDRFRARLTTEMDVPADRIDVIRNWSHVDLGVHTDSERVRSTYGWGDRPVVLHAGAMGEKQGLEEVLTAASLAQASGSPALFVLLGDGGQRSMLESRAEGLQNLQFLDPLPDAEFSAVLQAATILLVHERPGVVEMAVPSKLTSYFRAGVPVIAATDVRGTTADEIRRSGAGLWVPSGDPGALLRAVDELAANTNLKREMAEAGQRYAAALLTESVALDRYEAWIARLLERRIQDAV